MDASKESLLCFVRRVLQLRKEHPALRRRRFFRGRRIHGSDVRDITWFRPDGEEMSEEDWAEHWARALAVRLAGDALEELDPDTGERLVDSNLLLLLNAHSEPVTFSCPAVTEGEHWEVVLDTTDPLGEADAAEVPGGGEYELRDRAMALLSQRRDRRKRSR
jgi:glycogen operon protein